MSDRGMIGGGQKGDRSMSILNEWRKTSGLDFGPVRRILKRVEDILIFLHDKLKYF